MQRLSRIDCLRTFPRARPHPTPSRATGKGRAGVPAIAGRTGPGSERTSRHAEHGALRPEAEPGERRGGRRHGRARRPRGDRAQRPAQREGRRWGQDRNPGEHNKCGRSQHVLVDPVPLYRAT